MGKEDQHRVDREAHSQLQWKVGTGQGMRQARGRMTGLSGKERTYTTARHCTVLEEPCCAALRGAMGHCPRPIKEEKIEPQDNRAQQGTHSQARQGSKPGGGGCDERDVEWEDWTVKKWVMTGRNGRGMMRMARGAMVQKQYTRKGGWCGAKKAKQAVHAPNVFSLQDVNCQAINPKAFGGMGIADWAGLGWTLAEFEERTVGSNG